VLVDSYHVGTPGCGTVIYAVKHEVLLCTQAVTGGGKLLLCFLVNACGWKGCGELHKMQQGRGVKGDHERDFSVLYGSAVEWGEFSMLIWLRGMW